MHNNRVRVLGLEDLPQLLVLSKLNCKDVNELPKINEKVLTNLKVNLVVQINGKTRDMIVIDQDVDQDSANKLVLKSPKSKKYLNEKKILRVIYVKNKIINYIISN